MPASSRPPICVVARRWDRLGARLCAMANARTLARLLDLEFRFVWPRGRFRDLDDPTELFAADFVQRHEMDAEELARATPILAARHTTLQDLRSAAAQATGPTAVIVNEWARPIRLDEHTAAEASALYRDSFQAFPWSPAIDALRARIAALPADIRVALHIRAGDFVHGIRRGATPGEDWTNFLPAEKYVATGILGSFARDAAAAGHRVVAFSDSPDAVERIRAVHPGIVTPASLIPEVETATESQHALADILLMSRMDRIYAPGASAFSRLAAAVGGATLIGIRDQPGTDRALEAIRGFLTEHVTPPHARDPLCARDACWYLDLFADDLGADEQRRLARLSVAADPHFCHGENWLAATCALARDEAGFARASAAALRLAQTARSVHDDPYVETLAVATASQLLLSLFEPRRHARGLPRPPRDVAGPALATLPSLLPHQIHLHDLITNLRFQRSVVREAARQRMDLTPFIEEILTRPGGLRLPEWRCPGPHTMPDAAAYPGVLRLIETFTILLATALGNALAGSTTAPARKGFIETVIRSPTGLHWACGWASNGWLVGRRRLVGVGTGEGRVFWGITHLPRVDVAWRLKRPWARHSGFMVPLMSEPAAGALTLLRNRSAPAREGATRQPRSRR